MTRKKFTAIDSKPTDMAILVGKARHELPLQLEVVDIMATLAWANYKALVKQGFTPDQALELCKK